MSLSIAAAIVLTASAALPKVHVHAAGDAGFRANAYLVETANGVVAVDAPFTVSESKAFRAKLDALAKPLLAVLVTHAHPDHVNGIGALVAGAKAKVPVVALESVEKTLRAIDAPKRAYWTPFYGDEYPTSSVFPDRLVKDGASVTFDGVAFRVHDLGAGESEAEAVWVVDGAKAAFVGDLVLNRTHAWLAEGRSAAWLASLDRAAKLLGGVGTVYPGHGEAGTPAMLSWQKSYLQEYRAAVKALAKGRASLGEAGKKALAARMERFLPDAPLALLVAMGADAIAAELAAGK